MSNRTMFASRMWKPLLVVGVTAAVASCYFAIESDGAPGETGSTAVHHAAQTAAPNGGEQLTRAEWNARVTATKSIEEQTPAMQRRYYETWVGALQRAQDLQQKALEQLKAQSAELDAADPARAALDARVAQSEAELAARAARIDQHTLALAAAR